MSNSRKQYVLGAQEAAKRDPTALAHAIDLIFGTFCLGGAPSVIADFSNENKINAIGEHDTDALFNLLVKAFSHQGTSDQILRRYRRSLLLRLEYPCRPTMEDHVYRTAPMGPRVLISETWY